MANFNFPCQFIKVEDGTIIIKCRDLPELLSWPDKGESVETWAKHAVMDTLAFRIKDGLKVPYASKAKKGEFVVQLTPTEEAKILLHNEMLSAGVSRTALAQKAELSLPEVTRLLNLKHNTKIDSIASALNSLDRKFSLTVESL